ncbi:hypothetical protein FisN_2Lu360 [Fistulifera solaris]|uniref:Uncharacterized protein n=1 Tax=Fistulifera solaris TaxID=1519565 RepID=A0A1Z5J8F0_FISSO|nr:hypothetical protein FisN_2Lu360 [Fistulifera solaris]|eukprot:GAX10088.1 hypothetical protein FisN_2Lu360 [Fistulifera solaris]
MGESLEMRNYQPTLVQTRRFQSHFGVSPIQCSQLWILLKVPENARFKHLLWALLKLKVYATEEVLSGMAGCDEKTFRKWSDQFIDALSLLSSCLINWNSRKKNGVHTFSVDGTDCPINEPSPFSPKWYSHKFKSAGCGLAFRK